MLTQKDVLEKVVYDAHEGRFRALPGFHKRSPGEIIGTPHNKGYRFCCIKGNMILEHRLVWLYIYGYLPEKPFEIDHINGNKSDNRLTNLRILDHRNNCCNTHRHRAGHLPGATHVGSSHSNRTHPWQTIIEVAGVRKYIGNFRTEIEAHLAYCEATGVHPKIIPPPAIDNPP